MPVILIGSTPQGSFGADIAPRHVLEHGWGNEKVGKRALGRAQWVWGAS